MTDERLAELMVKAVDGLLTPAEADELMAFASTDPDTAQELRAHKALKGVTDGWVDRLVADAFEDGWERSAVTHGHRSIGWLLLLGGAGLLGGFGLWEFWLAPDAPWWVKLGSALLLGGLLMLVTSVVRWKWATRDDPYNKVIR